MAAADRIERLSRRLDETAGIALKLQERLDRIYGLAERELSLTLEGLLDGAADQVD